MKHSFCTDFSTAALRLGRLFASWATSPRNGYEVSWAGSGEPSVGLWAFSPAGMPGEARYLGLVEGLVFLAAIDQALQNSKKSFCVGH